MHMKKWFCIMLICLWTLMLYACSDSNHVVEENKWDCTVTCVEKSSENSYITTYSDEKIISNTGILSLQNQNDFDIVVHLLTNGQKERIAEIAAGGVSVLYEIIEGAEYTVGSHADVPEGVEIKLIVYDGEEADPFTNE